MTKIQMRRDTAENWTTNNPTLLSGEWALETDTRRMKIGDGITPYNTLPYSTTEDSEEWEKPAEWIDIRSGAIDNSIYFLVGHAADYSKYPEFAVNATISNSGTYDVYVDGVKQATTASATDTVLNWQTLNLVSGWDVTYPETLRTHIVRVTPSVSTNTITKIYLATNSSVNQGVLWTHFTLTNSIDPRLLFSIVSNIKCPLIEGVTAIGDEIKISSGGAMCIFRYCENLQYVPTLDLQKYATTISGTFQDCKKLKKVKIKNMGNNGDTYYLFNNCQELRKIEADGVFKLCYGDIFKNCYKLETLPPFTLKTNDGTANIFISNNGNLKDTFFDFSYINKISRVLVKGSNNYKQIGVKGIILNPSMEILGPNPQIDIRYNGLDRAALVNLFNSMPTVTGTKVCDITGCTGADDLTAADLAIATNKGWTITR